MGKVGSLNPILCWHWGNWAEGPDIDLFHVAAEDATHLGSGVSRVLPKLFRLNIFAGSYGDSDHGPQGK